MSRGRCDDCGGGLYLGRCPDPICNPLSKTNTPPAPAFPDPRTVEAVVAWLEAHPSKTETPFIISARLPVDDDDLGLPEGRGSTIHFITPQELAKALSRGDPFKETSDV